MRYHLLLSLAFLCVAGCHSPERSGPYSPLTDQGRNASRAEELTAQASAIVDESPERAEALLREALTEDLYHGPAHNNLGVLLLAQGQFYEAAGEFEWARKLMPGNPDPRLNLGLTLERAGHVDRALESYETALDVRPGHLPSRQAMARLLARNQPDDERLPELLRTLALQGETPSWRDWARKMSLER